MPAWTLPVLHVIIMNVNVLFYCFTREIRRKSAEWQTLTNILLLYVMTGTGVVQTEHYILQYATVWQKGRKEHVEHILLLKLQQSTEQNVDGNKVFSVYSP